SVDANITHLARLGVEVHITEMDVALPTGAGGRVLDPAALGRQAEIYGSIAGVCARNPGCTAFQTWGFTDKYSWIPYFTHFKMGGGLLFDADYRPKPSYDGVLKAFETVKQPPARQSCWVRLFSHRAVRGRTTFRYTWRQSPLPLTQAGFRTKNILPRRVALENLKNPE